MGGISKQIAMYIGLLLVCSTFTLISPFYPKIANNKGLPIWLIGMVFAINPVANLTTSILLSKHMNKVGRKAVMISSFVLTGLSMLILSPIEYLDTVPVIIMSFAARIVGGMGSGSIFTSIVSIFVSDYPDQVQIMIGRMEGAIGIGFIIGPLIGTALYLINLLAALIFVGAIILIFSPVAWKMLGTFKKYEIKEKIFLSGMMDVAFLFSFGFITTILQIHLSSYGLDQIYVALLFVLQSGVYFVSCMTIGSLLKGLDERTNMFIGALSLSLAYIMLGPYQGIFPKEVWVLCISLPLFGFGQAMTYSKIYLAFSIHYMVDAAVDDYGYENDDILTDVVSSYGVICCAIGEIIGPLYSGFVSDIWDIETACNLAGLMTFVFAIVYALGSGIFLDWFKQKTKRISNLIASELSSPIASAEKSVGH